MSDDAPCQLLTWDSEFFGFPIARVREQTLTPPRCEQIDAWCEANKIRCLYFQAASEDGPTQRLAASHGLFVVDVRMTFEWAALSRLPVPSEQAKLRAPGGMGSRSVPMLPSQRHGQEYQPMPPEEDPSLGVRIATPQDVEALESIAAQSHRRTRFYLDGGFPPEKCDELYRIWIRRCCNDPQCTVLVAQLHDRVCGYVTCEPLPGHAGRIGLIAVKDSARGRGIGAELVQAAQNWFAARQLNVSVVTQGHNIAAQRLYQRCGFLASSVHLYYHKWFGN